MKLNALVSDRSLTQFERNLLQCNFVQGTEELFRALDRDLVVENIGDFSVVKINTSMNSTEIHRLLSGHNRVSASAIDMINQCVVNDKLGYDKPVIATGTVIHCANGFDCYMCVHRSGNKRSISFLRINMKFSSDYSFLICKFNETKSKEVPS